MTTTGRRENGTATVSFTATVATIAVVGIVVVGQMFVTIPMMPTLADAWHTTPEAATWATTAFGVAYALGSLLSGRLSIRYGTRNVMVANILAMAAVTLTVPLGASLVTGSLLRAAQGLLAGAFVPLAYAYLSARIPPARLPLALTIASCAMSGTVVYGQVESQLLESAFGWRSVFLVTAPLLVLCALLVRRVLLPDTPGELTSAPGQRHGAARGPRALLYLVTLGVAGSVTAIYTGVQLYGPPELVGDHDAMLALRASALPGLLAAVLVAQALGTVVATRRAAGGFAVAGLGMLAVAALAGNVFGLGAALLVFILGISGVGPALVQAVGDRAGGERSAAIAKYGFMLNLGGGMGAQLPPLLSDLTNLALLIAGLVGTGAAAIVISTRPSRKDREIET